MGGLLALVFITGHPLIYGSKKMLVHGISHTLVNRVGSRAKLDEGSAQKDSVCVMEYIIAPKLCMKLMKFLKE